MKTVITLSVVVLTGIVIYEFYPVIKAKMGGKSAPIVVPTAAAQ